MFKSVHYMESIIWFFNTTPIEREWREGSYAFLLQLYWYWLILDQPVSSVSLCVKVAPWRIILGVILTKTWVGKIYFKILTRIKTCGLKERSIKRSKQPSSEYYGLPRKSFCPTVHNGNAFEEKQIIFNPKFSFILSPCQFQVCHC